jgi:transposase
VEDWAEIRRLYRAEGLPIKAIVRVLGVSRNTVRAAIGSDVPPKYERTPVGSIVDEVEPRIRELLQAYPRMPATVIAERIGWTRGLTVFKERVAELRPVYLPPDPAGRTTYVAGEIAQCDLWFPPIHLPGGVRAGPSPGAAAGVDDDHRILTLAVGDVDPDPLGGGSVRGVVAADRGVGRGAAGAGLGW